MDPTADTVMITDIAAANVAANWKVGSSTAAPTLSSWTMDMSPNGDSKFVEFTFNQPVLKAQMTVANVSVAKNDATAAQALTGTATQTGYNKIKVTALTAAVVNGINTAASIKTSAGSAYTAVLAGTFMKSIDGNANSAAVANFGAPTFTADTTAPKIVSAVGVNGMASNTAIAITYDDYMTVAVHAATNYTATTGDTATVADGDGDGAVGLVGNLLTAGDTPWTNGDTLLAKSTVVDIAGNAIDITKDTITFTNAAAAATDDNNTID